VNAAILLVTSAWMAGHTPDVIIPVGHASQGPSCGASCDDSCNGGIGARLRECFSGLFQRNDCNDRCEPQRCERQHCAPQRCERQRCEPQRCERQHCAPQRCERQRCEPQRCEPQRCEREPRCRQWNFGHRDDCNNSCDSGCNFFGRLRGLFHRDNDCCEGGTHNGACAPGAVPAPEPLRDQPRKMPSKTAAPREEVRVITTPDQSPLPVIQTAPGAVTVPALTPRNIESDTRTPF
jgi:hypothetical protein